MALTQWLPISNRNGSAQSPGVIPTGGATELYLQINTGPTDFIDPSEILDFEIDWSSNGGTVYGHLAGGRFVGAPTIDTKSGVRSVSVPIPPGCTHMRGSYTVVAGGPIRFGLLGEWR
jgi:hypothetical protein